MDQIIRLKRTITPNHPPTTLDHGELAAGLVDDPVKLWIGTPSGVKEIPLGGGGAYVGTSPPINPREGAFWFDDVGGQLYVFDAADQWVVAVNQPGGGGGAGGGITIDDTPPDNPQVGTLWINDDQLYVLEESGWIPIVQMARWSMRRISPDNQLYGCAYGNGMFVATGGSTATGSRAFSSSDGINWTFRPTNNNNSLMSVAHGNNTFVTVSNTSAGTDPRIMSSSDGITWITRSPPVNNLFTRVRFVNGLFYVCSSTTNASPSRVITSPDGINWTPVSVPDANWRDIAYGNGTYVMVASDGVGRALTSSDGITWTRHTTADEFVAWALVTYGAGLFVAMPATNRFMTSPDGINWTDHQPIETASSVIPQWSDIIYAQNMFVAVAANSTTGFYNRIAISHDGINWRIRQAPSDQAWQSIAYGDGLFVSVTWNGSGLKIMTSNSP